MGMKGKPRREKSKATRKSKAVEKSPQVNSLSPVRFMVVCLRTCFVRDKATSCDFFGEDVLMDLRKTRNGTRMSVENVAVMIREPQ